MLNLLQLATMLHWRSLTILNLFQLKIVMSLEKSATYVKAFNSTETFSS